MTYPGPPKHIAPERLFRLLLGRPRPVLPLDLRLDCAPRVALSVRALTPWEDESARDVPPDLPIAARASQVLQRLVVGALLADDEPAFRRTADLGTFSERELGVMGAAVVGALDVVSPALRRIDRTLWNAYLEAGAKHGSNGSIVNAIGASAIEVGARGNLRFMPRWHDYFGGAFADVTDGQRMAYDAASKVFESWCK